MTYNLFMSIRIIHLAKDNEVDTLTCSECGASLRHAIEINSVIYGMDCGARFLGWKESSVKSRVRALTFEINNYMAVYNFYKAGKITEKWVKSSAGRLAQTLGIDFSWDDPDGLEKVFNFVNRKI